MVAVKKNIFFSKNLFLEKKLFFLLEKLEPRTSATNQNQISDMCIKQLAKKIFFVQQKNFFVSCLLLKCLIKHIKIF